MDYELKLKAKKEGKWSKWRGNRTAQQKRYKERYGHRIKAAGKLNWAIISGKIDKPDECSKCGISGQILGHHEDYNKPLDVEWLCQDCHNEVHKRYRKELVGVYNEV